MQTHYDIVIVGGGLVGASLALALGQADRFRVALLEPRPARLEGLDQPDDWDARVYAVSPANQRFLASMDAWPDMSRMAAVSKMDVRGDAGGRIEFDAAGAGAGALAWIAENRWVLAGIWRALRETPVEILHERPVAFESDHGRAALTLNDGRLLTARLVVGCDGANSWLRSEAGIDIRVSPYGHSGVVANFLCERDHGGVAHQWFTGDGVLAYLPLPECRMSMVWSCADPERLLALSGDELCRQVAERGQFTLGELSLLTPAQAFPLRLIRPVQVIGTRLVLAGDAAHTIHPLAGQGVNLGFGDAILLAKLLAQADDPGSRLLLRSYERGRLESVRTMQYTCDALFRLFTHPHPAIGWLRNTGLKFTNALGPVKRQLVKEAMGL
ncbi:UbiH/UbiF family hydroxylase [Laribacter hongkongensis]|uniref:UbiH/UbiF family hydroxylase n=1 Tax=Laribacter hongkongensis TaxID=168471 RepID=UPI001EFD618D|nr:UbiH/UbiF family hydroxylase [Laribacter hongkongensis]MCG9052243.1 UbiH/UbiF family hydroxylase [Laribacter hongkongensis]